jgi:hypothetical protein
MAVKSFIGLALEKKVLITYLLLILLSCMTHCYYKGFLDLGLLTFDRWPFLVYHNFQEVTSIPGNSVPRKLLNLLPPFLYSYLGLPMPNNLPI